MHCNVCNSTRNIELIKINDIPTHCNLLFNSKEAALKIPKGSINLTFCENCEHLFNADFNPELMHYSALYENSLHYSPLFREYALKLAKYLIEKYHLYNKTIIEIGCGRGDFLKHICNLGDNKGYGFDKSYTPEKNNKTAGEKVKFIQDFYSVKYSSLSADFILCRQVLEHIESPNSFLKEIINANRKDNFSVFFEVPNSLFIIQDLSIWDLIYEHCSYFTSTSLEFLFLRSKFSVERLFTDFNNQYLSIEATAMGKNNSKINDEKIGALKEYLTGFKRKFEQKIHLFKNVIEENYKKGNKIVIWGAGSKAVSFLNFLNIRKQVEFVVDVNPMKNQKYIAGTGNKIVNPDFLRQFKPDVVFIMNKIYGNEIRHLLDNLGIRPKLISV